jgi:hypothetical protein
LTLTRPTLNCLAISQTSKKSLKEFLKDLDYDPAILCEGPLQLSNLKELLRREGHFLSNFEDQHLSAIPRICRNNARLIG